MITEQEFRARFEARIDRSGPCWNWTGSINRTLGGYGMARKTPKGGRDYAHRVAYRLLVGPIPEGLTIDHICRNRSCVNPGHLEAVPRGINVLRGIGNSAMNRRKTHCPQGHPYDAANTRLKANGWRICRACHRTEQPASPEAAQAKKDRDRRYYQQVRKRR